MSKKPVKEPQMTLYQAILIICRYHVSPAPPGIDFTVHRVPNEPYTGDYSDAWETLLRYKNIAKKLYIELPRE